MREKIFLRLVGFVNTSLTFLIYIGKYNKAEGFKMNDSKDDLGDRMKSYESLTDKVLDKSLPLIVRIDGRGFSKFTKGLEKPYCKELHNLMVDTTKFLCEETNAILGYTQSDEITLVLNLNDDKQQYWFGGKLQKLVSSIASSATGYFNKHSPHPKVTNFDTRVFEVPSKDETANAVLWRVIDCRKNAVSSLARCHFSHKALQNKTGYEMLDMLREFGVLFEDFPLEFREGTFIKKVTSYNTLTKQEIEKLPEKHFARTNPGQSFERTSYSKMNLFFKELTHRQRVDFVFMDRWMDLMTMPVESYIKGDSR